MIGCHHNIVFLNPSASLHIYADTSKGLIGKKTDEEITRRESE